SVGVRPVVGSVVTSPTLKMPNCIRLLPPHGTSPRPRIRLVLLLIDNSTSYVTTAAARIFLRTVPADRRSVPAIDRCRPSIGASHRSVPAIDGDDRRTVTVASPDQVAREPDGKG